MSGTLSVIFSDNYMIKTKREVCKSTKTKVLTVTATIKLTMTIFMTITIRTKFLTIIILVMRVIQLSYSLKVP